MTGRAPIRVLVVDDDPNFVEAVTTMLDANQEVAVVGAASNGREALERVSELEPSVVAMDVAMPLMDGLDATRAICARAPDCRVILFSGSIFAAQSEDARELAQEAGAAGYVAKSRVALDLVEAVLSVAEGSASPDDVRTPA